MSPNGPRIDFQWQVDGQNVVITRCYPDGSCESRSIPINLIEKMCGKIDPNSVAFLECLNAFLGQQRVPNAVPVPAVTANGPRYLDLEYFTITVDGYTSSSVLLDDIADMFKVTGQEFLDVLTARYSVTIESNDTSVTITLEPLPNQDSFELGLPHHIADFLVGPE
ncbi:MAG: hypothetical protein HJJLKODD_02121 [Phycisphaerae bacterium]|nr:hypothetical protein [Phycisphaerae bacterium]